MDNASFEVKLNEYRSCIERELSLIFENDKYKGSAVVDAMKYSLLNGGKRIRGIFALAFCDGICNSYEKAINFACALEMVHCYSLIHDDLPCMDDDDFRRGKLSCHKKFDQATALLAGDGLLTLAFEVMSLSGHPDIAKMIILLTQACGVLGMIGGQMTDLLSENKSLNYHELVKMHQQKTGALIKASCQLGAASAGDSFNNTLHGQKSSPYRQIRWFEYVEAYGETVGLVFQIKDDILNVTTDRDILGKPVNSDEEKGKSNFISNLGIAQSKKHSEELTAKAIDILDEMENYTSKSRYKFNAAFLKQFTSMLLNREF